VERLARFLDLWFDHGGGDVGDPADVVGPLLAYNHPAPPATFDGSVEVLVVENQGVWLWGRDADGRHVERENEDGKAWRPTGESTEEFWIHHAAFDVVSTSLVRRSAQELDTETVRRIRDATTPMPCGSWSWPGTGHSLFHRGASVVMICEDGSRHWVVAAGPAEADLQWLDDLGLEWDEWDSRRDDP
jgi:hypothetical protein